MLNNTQQEEKPGPAPKKFVAFSSHDSRAVETTYQALADEFDDPLKEATYPPYADGSDGSPKDLHASKAKVPVHEDFLFEVDIENRELSPVYWLGPTYEVRRGM